MSPITSTLANSSAYGYRTFAAAAAPAFESIATATPTSGTSITFSSIPSTYQHLQIRMILRDTFTTFGADYALALKFNGSSANYTSHEVNGTGSAVAARGVTATSSMNLYASGLWSGGTVPASTFAATIIDIHDYASTTKNKTVRYLAGADYNSATGVNYGMVIGSGAWLDTSAISSFQISGLAGTFDTGTTISLYGIKGA